MKMIRQCPASALDIVVTVLFYQSWLVKTDDYVVNVLILLWTDTVFGEDKGYISIGYYKFEELSSCLIFTKPESQIKWE